MSYADVFMAYAYAVTFICSHKTSSFVYHMNLYPNKLNFVFTSIKMQQF